MSNLDMQNITDGEYKFITKCCKCSPNKYGEAYGVITYNKMGKIYRDKVVWTAERVKKGRIGLTLPKRYMLVDARAYVNYMTDWLADGTIKLISK